MGYLVVVSIMGYIYYYLVNFTAMFGWKVSWVWYYTCMASMFMQFVIVDPIIAVFHWLVYKKFRKAANLCQKCRSMSQGYNEAYDPSEGEEEERKQKEMEEKQKEIDSKVEAKKAAILAKRGIKAKKGGLFDDTAGNGGAEEIKKDSGSDNIAKAGHETAEEALNGGSNGSSDNLNNNNDVTSKKSKSGTIKKKKRANTLKSKQE